MTMHKDDPVAVGGPRSCSLAAIAELATRGVCHLIVLEAGLRLGRVGVLMDVLMCAGDTVQLKNMWHVTFVHLPPD